MTREERLEFCTICLNRKMNPQKGLVCQFTNEYADFEENCNDFKEDTEEKKRKLIRDLNSSGHQKASKSLDPKQNKENGTIIFLIGIGVFIFTMYSFNSLGILIVPFGAIIYGARTYYKGAEQEKIIEKQQTLEKEKIQP